MKTKSQRLHFVLVATIVLVFVSAISFVFGLIESPSSYTHDVVQTEETTEFVGLIQPELRSIQMSEVQTGVHIRVSFAQLDNYETARAGIFGEENYTYWTDDQPVDCLEIERVCFAEFHVEGMISGEYQVGLILTDREGYQGTSGTGYIYPWGNVTKQY